MTFPLWILGALLVLLAYYFNSLVSLKIRAANAWSDVDVQLKRRYDLIPNLVEVVKGYAAHEKGLFEKVAEWRSRASAAAGARDKAAPEAEFNRALSGLLAVVEHYPDLKADGQFRNLQKNLAEVEDDLAHARRYYNAVVRDYNTCTRQFPRNLVAAAFRFEPLPFFEAGTDERGVVKIDLGKTSK